MTAGAFDEGALDTDAPSWRRELRRSALEAFQRSALPTADEEEWRYSRIADLDLQAFAPVDPRDARARGGETAAQAAALLEAVGERDGLVTTVDGYVTGSECASRARQAGALVGRLDADEAPPSYGELLGARRDAFGHLAEAFAPDIVLVDVPAGVRLERPVVILHELTTGTGTDASPASFPRTFVRLGEGAAATVVECYLSSPGPRLALPVTELEVGDAARLAYESVQVLDPATWQLATQTSRVGRAAHLLSFAAALGGGYARLATHSVLGAEGAESRLLALYLGDGEQVIDLRTFQDHAAPHTTSELVYKGAVSDRSRSVYTGLIHMRRGARKSVASQTNRNLVLSEGAHADSVPNLDIEENDVRCSHASAVGPIDAEQRFAVESRGVPPESAQRLLLLGFFDDLLEQAPVAGVSSWLRTHIARRLGAGTGSSTARVLVDAGGPV